MSSAVGMPATLILSARVSAKSLPAADGSAREGPAVGSGTRSSSTEDEATALAVSSDPAAPVTGDEATGAGAELPVDVDGLDAAVLRAACLSETWWRISRSIAETADSDAATDPDDAPAVSPH